jgi:hypothetical protein
MILKPVLNCFMVSFGGNTLTSELPTVVLIALEGAFGITVLASTEEVPLKMASPPPISAATFSEIFERGPLFLAFSSPMVTLEIS